MFEKELIIWMKMDLALNNLQGLICHKTQTTNLSVQSNISFIGTQFKCQTVIFDQ